MRNLRSSKKVEYYNIFKKSNIIEPLPALPTPLSTKHGNNVPSTMPLDFSVIF